MLAGARISSSRDQVMSVPCHAPAPSLVTYTHREFLIPLYSQFCQHFIKPDQKQRGLRKPPFPAPSSAKVCKSYCSLWRRLRGVQLGQGNWELGQAGWITHSSAERAGSGAGQEAGPAQLS